ncbi:MULTISPECIES: DMT family transporter [Enterobacter]|jgi:drug/metabolite transporter (DMT)-like permease|uniref:Threonine/homoserine exporter RhtA n=1 Tax=Enterobacter cancerogenus TaxID=69218 RepID=A0ABX8KQ67_9ENTR|nr:MULTISPECIES: DMT family transporter [Enterobacter]AUJ83210.1 EamA/RhaT family transporter [Enterobacter cancerogenus]EFC53842.1 putative membrane protein [Enterobacter cancerogenus ATCC 35316]EKS7428534.1 DMT family transporter [Enterobacter cancerogenus]KTQ47830.1 multidrug DMT transporter [Enterobacter cancerogenus]KTQ49886.1 multidrug DMT transporter [Enterobacter cancerogenus]
MDTALPVPVFARRHVAYACATLCCLLWGSSYPAIKSGYELFQIATDDIPSKVVFAGYRFLFAGALLLLFALAQRKPIARLTPAQFGQLTILGLTQTSIQYTFFYIGLAYTTGVNGSIMNATGTFFSVLLAHFIYHNDKLSYNKTLGCILGFAGVMLVNFHSGLSEFHFVWNGDGFVVLAAFILSAATLYGKRISQTVDPTVMTGWQLAIGGLVLVIGGYVTGGTLEVHSFTAAAVLGYLTLLSSVAFALWSVLLKVNRVSMIAPFNFVVPVAGTVLSAIFLGENILDIKYAIALVLVCSGIWWVNKRRA